MSLKDYLRVALRIGSKEKDADSASSWKWLIDGAKGGARPKPRSEVPSGTGGEDHDLLRKAIDLENQLKERARLEAAATPRADRDGGYDVFLTKHHDLVDKFLEIAERKISVLDDYGDENWDALPAEVHNCLIKLAKREQSIDVSKCSQKSTLLGGYEYPCARHLAASLHSKFRAYHEARKQLPNTAQGFLGLTGIDLETRLANLLKEAGFGVAGTPATGDQGADLIAKKHGRTIAIQAKGYKGPVGNGAVQEIVGALRFYNADEGWVVTNSTFTPSARSLARANNIKLIDGNDLKDLAALRTRL
jgi:restriction endonuclease